MAEVRHLVEQEWAASAEDVVWRRSKLGLRLDAGQIAAVRRYVSELRGGPDRVRAMRAATSVVQ